MKDVFSSKRFTKFSNKLIPNEKEREDRVKREVIGTAKHASPGRGPRAVVGGA
jgi:hypothetical protein